MLSSVLVIDNESRLRATIAMLLQNSGYQVSTAEDGVKALSRLGEDLYRLVLLDLELPDIPGIEILRTIRSSYPNLLVVVFTSEASPDIIQEALELGVNDYLLKPSDPNFIIEKLRSLLS